MPLVPESVQRYTSNLLIPIYKYAVAHWHEAINAFADIVDAAIGADRSRITAIENTMAVGLPASAPVWVSGQAYAAGFCAYSPIDFKTYRRKTAGSGILDPSADATNWGTPLAGLSELQADRAAIVAAAGLVNNPADSAQELAALKILITGKNKLLNTNFENPVNQLGKASRVTTAGAYNFDCWYYGADTKFYQAADYLNLSASQQYTLNWSGTATAEYLFTTARSTTIEAQGGWTAIAKGAQITTPADVISGAKFLWIRGIGVTAALSTFDKPQLEEGLIATTYERKLFEQVIADCIPFYEHSSDYGTPPTGGNYSGLLRLASTAATLASIGGFTYKRKRFTPSITIYNPVSGATGSVYRVSDGAPVAVSAVANIGQNGVGEITIASGSDNGYLLHFTANSRI